MPPSPPAFPRIETNQVLRVQSVRQLDGEYFTGATSHDQITVLAVVFHDGVSVMLMPEVPIEASEPAIVITPLALTVAALTLPPVRSPCPSPSR